MPFPLESLPLAAGLAEGLHGIHTVGVVHRDLKPANVLLVADGPRVIGFGIARALDCSSLTPGSVVIGTLGFMPPKVLRAITVSWSPPEQWPTETPWPTPVTCCYVVTASPTRLSAGSGRCGSSSSARPPAPRVRRGDGDAAGHVPSTPRARSSSRSDRRSPGKASIRSAWAARMLCAGAWGPAPRARRTVTSATARAAHH